MGQYDRGGGFMVKHLVLVLLVAGVVVAGYIGWRLSDDALAVLVGVVISGLLLGVPSWVLVILLNRTRQLEIQERMARQAQNQGPRPPLVLVQGGAERRELPPGWSPPPALHYGQPYQDQMGDLVDGETGYPIDQGQQIREFGE